MTEQSGRQWRGTERTEIVIEHTEMVGNRRECHRKAGEQWRIPPDKEIIFFYLSCGQDKIKFEVIEVQNVITVRLDK